MLEQAAERFHAFGNADRLKRHIGLNGLIHRDGMKIDMQNSAAHGGMLNFLDERRAIRFFAGDFKLDENVLAGGVAQHRVDVAGGDL